MYTFLKNVIQIIKYNWQIESVDASPNKYKWDIKLLGILESNTTQWFRNDVDRRIISHWVEDIYKEDI